MTLCRAELDTYKAPPHPDFADGYWLVCRNSVGKPLRTSPAPEYGEGSQFSSEVDICYELPADYQRKTGRRKSKGINPWKCTDGHNSLDLTLSLQDKKDPQKTITTLYSHLVACSFFEADRGCAWQALQTVAKKYAGAGLQPGGVISDNSDGFCNAFEKVWPGARLGQCWPHILLASSLRVTIARRSGLALRRSRRTCTPVQHPHGV